MRKIIDLTGQVFGRLKVISFDCSTYGQARWKCACECGTLLTIYSSSLRTGASKSCGCLKNELFGKAVFVHGEASKTKEYKAWASMKDRCLNSNGKMYSYYGGRGIKICERWLGSYANFLSDMGRAPSKLHSVDRIRNNENYEPANCRWATKKEQVDNRRSSVMVSFNGEAKSIHQWIEYLNLKIPYNTIRKRIRVFGWTPERAFT